MANPSLQAESVRANAVKEAFDKFRLCDSTPLNATGIDAVHELLPMIYSIATLIEMGHRKDLSGDAALDNVNPELIASAFDGIAHLAAMAMFHAEPH